MENKEEQNALDQHAMLECAQKLPKELGAKLETNATVYFAMLPYISGKCSYEKALEKLGIDLLQACEHLEKKMFTILDFNDCARPQIDKLIELLEKNIELTTEKEDKKGNCPRAGWEPIGG